VAPNYAGDRRAWAHLATMSGAELPSTFAPVSSRAARFPQRSAASRHSATVRTRREHTSPVDVDSVTPAAVDLCIEIAARAGDRVDDINRDPEQSGAFQRETCPGLIE
jgi:hypothetical protein